MSSYKGGRPKGANDGDSGTKQVRMNSDLAEMISWICRIDNISSAQLIDPLLRAQITAKFKTIENDVRHIQSLENQAKEAEEAARQASGAAVKKKKA